MSTNPLNEAAKRENAMTLADALGVTTQAAATMLDARVAVSSEPEDAIGTAMADDVAKLLGRTLSSIERHEGRRSNSVRGNLSAEVVFGRAQGSDGVPTIFVSVESDRVIIRRASDGVDRGAPSANIPRLVVRLAACYVAAATLQSVLGGAAFITMPNPFELRFAELGVTHDQLESRIDIGHTYLAGAGAIGNGFLWAAEHLDIHGFLEIADDDVVSDGNLNRQILLEPEDVSHAKAERLAARAAPLTPNLTLRPRPLRLQDLDDRSDGPWLSRLIVAVDSRRARRALQKELPGEVFDASTTDIREVILHHNKQPSTSACMACIYLPDEEEYTREHHIAEMLGVSVVDVRTERVSRESAARIAAKYTTLSVDEIAGTAYDTLFKQLCGEGQLQVPDGKRILAPFAFVSCLAGVLLLIDLVRHLAPGTASPTDNYWRVSAWHPPLSRRREVRPREARCEVCSNSVLMDVNISLWGARTA